MLIKFQRIIWIFAGVLFLIAAILNIAEGKPLNLRFFLLIAAGGLSFLNAYVFNKRIDKK